MKESTKITFKIEGFDPGTLPLERLAKYLKELADLYGSAASVHFDKVETGCAALASYVDKSALVQVQDRITLASQDAAPEKLKKTWKNINDYLRADNTHAALLVGEPDAPTKTLEFPGIKVEPEKDWPPIKERCAIQGELVSVGGRDQSVQAFIRCNNGIIQKGTTTRSVAKALGKSLFTQVRLHGVGSWVRLSTGEWQLQGFVINEVEELGSDNLTTIAEKLRTIKGSGWEELDDPFGFLEEIRNSA